MDIKTNWVLQGDMLKLTPLIFLSTKSLYNIWHLEKFWAKFDGILYLENLGGVTLYEVVLIIQNSLPFPEKSEFGRTPKSLRAGDISGSRWWDRTVRRSATSSMATRR